MTDDNYDKFIELKWPEGMKEEDKEIFRQMVKHIVKEKERLCVVYNPNCGCLIDQMVVLDRYPMSPKILSVCPECMKGCLMEISEPIRFYIPLLNQDISLEELKKSHITESPQKWIIERYIENK